MSMGTDRLRRLSSRATMSPAANTVLYVGCFVFIFISFVGLSFLGVRPGELGLDTVIINDNSPAASDTLRQIMFIGSFLVLLISYLNRRGIASLITLLPLHIYWLFGWAAATLLWSPVPALGGRRLAIMAMIVACAFMMVKSLGAERTVRFVFSFLLASVFLSVIAGFLFPTIAINQFDPREIGITGNWRGMFEHKNVAAFVAAACFIDLIFSSRSYALKGTGLAASAFLLWMSDGKAAFGILPASLVLYLIFVLTARKMGILFAFMALLVMLLMGLLFLDDIELILSRPDALTGRILLWTEVVHFLQEHFWTGGGFGSIFSAGLESPLLPYLDGWARWASHAHNGVLNILVQIGFPGAVLSLFSFFIWPLLRLSKQSTLGTGTRHTIMCLYVFMILQNLTESNIMEQNAASVLLILFCAVAASLQTDNSLQEAAGLRKSRTLVRRGASHPIRF
jgi:exopolysaccharide production protein ExoQ